MNRTIVVTSIFLFSLSLFGKGRTELIYGNIYKSIITDLNLPQNSIYVTDTLINLKASAFYFEKMAQLQISVAYFCSIGLYFLV